MSTPDVTTVPSEPDAAQIKVCCASGYSSDVVRLLLGAAYHPGGAALTRRLLDLLALEPRERLVDIASGVGTSSLLAAREYGVRVDGVDLSEANVKLASSTTAGAALDDRASFHLGDAESLPLPDAAFDAVICECALCTFPDKAAAAGEMARILRPGGRVGIADVIADRTRLPSELTGITAWVACVADARPIEEYRRVLTEAGLQVSSIEPHTDALERMITQIDARLGLLRMTARPKLEALGVDFSRTGPVLEAARAAVRDGILDYALITAEKPCA